MKTIERVVGAAGAFLLMGIAAAAQAQEPASPPASVQELARPAPPVDSTSFEVTGRFTAQRRPRVTVLNFEDTNAEAQNARYGSSVEAMLVTFLKRKSQFVVVERQKLKGMLDEKQRMQKGMISLEPDDPAARELLEKLDAFILGSVTLLNVEDDVKIPSKSSETAAEAPGPEATTVGDAPQARSDTREEIRGPRIEIDAKLSRFDGRIIAAAQRRGPVACLRSIIERLGIALEQEFLRPYYGKLLVNLDAPENVRVFLTPILLDNALDEEKPPVELGSTVTIGSESDDVEGWVTDPTTYRIENLLSGWYSVRLERPGYEKIEMDPGRWEARKTSGPMEVYDRVTDLPLSRTTSDLSRFVVHVDPLKTEVFDGNKRRFVFRKKVGSLAPQVKRQYIDSDFSRTPQRVILMGGKDLELNQTDRPKEYAVDLRCDLFDEKPSILSNYGSTYVASGQTFNVDDFKGGELIIEDYKGESVPSGRYRMALWEPHYQLEEINVSVRDQDSRKKTPTLLKRETLPLELGITGARPASRAFLEGRDTHHRVELPLDFSDAKEQPGLPVDVYTASTNIPGLDAWRQSAELLPGAASPPVYDTHSKPNEPKLISGSQEKEEHTEPPHLTIKTRLGIAGRLNVFSQPPDPLAADIFIDRKILKIFNLLLYGHEERPEEQRSGFLQAAARVGRSTIRILGDTPIVPGSPGSEGTPGTGSVPPQKTDGSATNGTGTTSPPEERNALPRPEFPRDPDALRKLLAEHLTVIDLLVLDPRDMAQLRRSPEAADIIGRYVESGGALFAFVSETGDYGEVVRSPLVIEEASRPTDRFSLVPGEVAGIIPRFDKKVSVKSRRALPELSQLSPGPWRVIAFTQGHKEPRIVERGKREGGGYVALWFDDPASFRGRLGGTVPKVEETRGKVEERILDWARYIMYRRYDKSGEERRRAESVISRITSEALAGH